MSAVLALTIQPTVTLAADPGASVPRLVEGTTGPVVAFDGDDGEDHFDEGDDEFDCDNDNEGEDPCVDDPPDRVDAGDDEFESGCANFDDGEDRCLDDDNEDRFDEGDDEFDARCSGGASCVLPPPSKVTSDPQPTAAVTTTGVPGDLAIVGAIALGLGGLYLIRRPRP
jgi:hypothetical protein